MIAIATLMLTALASAIAVAIGSSLICAQIIPDAWPSRWWAPVGVVFAVLLDHFGVRPLAVHRQVPQWWGHRYGPLAAAARYGPRLGVGPATILTTWLWWAGLILVALTSPWWAVIGSVGFVVARIAAMALSVAGIRDGSAMAHRMSQVQSWRPAVRILASTTAIVASLAAAALA